MGVHTCLSGQSNVLGKGIGCNRYDWDLPGVGSAGIPDTFRRLAAVHYWHLHIHQDKIKIERFMFQIKILNFIVKHK